MFCRRHSVRGCASSANTHHSDAVAATDWEYIDAMKLALPFPRQRQDAPARSPGSLRLLLVAACVVALAGALAFWRMRPDNAAASQVFAPVVRGDLAIEIESGGSAAPAQQVDLSFAASGTVSAVHVKAGDRVAAGQPLARLDDRELKLQVQQAEADRRAAQARLGQARGGSATPQDLASAQANLRAAEAGLEKTRTGNITTADLREAEAMLRAAQAQLDALRNPSADKRSTAELALSQAQTDLQKTRDNASATKTRAELDMQRATQTLTQAQSAYATALQSWQHVQERGTDPTNPTTSAAQGERVPNKLNDAQRQQYYDAFVQAQAALHSAEAGMQQAQVAFDNARQQEAAEVAQAQAQLDNAQTQHDALLHPSHSALAEAQAGVTRAQATLDRLRRGGTPADVAAAEAQVEMARAALEKLSAPAAAADIAAAEAAAAQADARLASARLKLDAATLRAPFDGTVATVNVTPGGVSGTDTAVTLIDDSTWHLDAELSEIDVARVKPGQPVNISFDAFAGTIISGVVESVATVGTSSNGVVTYAVRVSFDPGETAVKAGMSASATIVAETHKGVLQVPSRALTTQGPVTTLQVRYGDGTAAVQVETGASDGMMTEVVSCPAIGRLCLREGDEVKIELPESVQTPNSGDHMFFSTAAGTKGGAPIKIERIEGP
jgi:HlyD family secretion protein